MLSKLPVGHVKPVLSKTGKATEKFIFQILERFSELAFHWQENEKGEVLDKLKVQLVGVDVQLKERSGELSHAESVVEQLTEELGKTQDDLTKTLEKVTRLEGSITALTEKLEHAQAEVRRARARARARGILKPDAHLVV